MVLEAHKKIQRAVFKEFGVDAQPLTTPTKAFAEKYQPTLDMIKAKFGLESSTGKHPRRLLIQTDTFP